MPIASSYRLHKETLAVIRDSSGLRGCALIPAGATVQLVSGVLEGARMTQVKWNDSLMLVFTLDFRERAIPLNAHEAEVFESIRSRAG
jgi:hypothetical protein